LLGDFVDDSVRSAESIVMRANESAARRLAEFAAVPDCQHSIAVQPQWRKISRNDVAAGARGGSMDGATIYDVAVYRASREDMAARISVARLDSFKVVAPAVHLIKGQLPRAELLMEHSSKEDGVVHIVFPIVAGNESLPVLDWLTLPKTPCGWMLWLTGGCPGGLKSRDLISDKQKVLRYLHPGCPETFVVTEPLVATSQQLEGLDSGAARQLGVRGKDLLSGPPLQVTEVVIGVLLPRGALFTVFSTRELAERKLIALGGLVGTALFIVCFFLCARNRATSSGRPAGKHMVEFAQGKCLRFCLFFGHWFIVSASVAVPFVAVMKRHINESSGMPWEYHLAFVSCFVLQAFHELVWFCKTGSLASLLTNGEVVVYVIVSFLSCLDHYLDITFIAIATVVGSQLAWASFGWFVLFTSPVQNIFWFAFVVMIQEKKALDCVCNSDPVVATIFRPRGMEVLHAVLSRDIQSQGRLANDEDCALNARAGNFFCALRYQFQTFLQSSVQIMFLFLYGFRFPTVLLSIAVKLFLFFYGTIMVGRDNGKWRACVVPLEVIELAAGMTVVVKGLVSAPHLNGMSGVCQRLDLENGLWVVTLQTGDHKGFKPANLIACAAPGQAGNDKEDEPKEDDPFVDNDEEFARRLQLQDEEELKHAEGHGASPRGQQAAEKRPLILGNGQVARPTSTTSSREDRKRGARFAEEADEWEADAPPRGRASFSQDSPEQYSPQSRQGDPGGLGFLDVQHPPRQR